MPTELENLHQNVVPIMINKALVAIFHLEDNLMPFIVAVHMTLSNSHSAIENSFVSLKKILLHAEDQSHVRNSG